MLGDALKHLAVLRQHLASTDLDDQTVADAVALRLSAAIESVSKIDQGLRTETFGAEWALMWATRNRIAHGYAFIDRRMIGATVREDLPRFELAVRRLMQELTSE